MVYRDIICNNPFRLITDRRAMLAPENRASRVLPLSKPRMAFIHVIFVREGGRAPLS